MGGVDKVANALSYSQTIEDFGRELRLQSADVKHFRSVLVAVENGDDGAGDINPDAEEVCELPERPAYSDGGALAEA